MSCILVWFTIASVWWCKNNNNIYIFWNFLVSVALHLVQCCSYHFLCLILLKKGKKTILVVKQIGVLIEVLITKWVWRYPNLKLFSFVIRQLQLNHCYLNDGERERVEKMLDLGALLDSMLHINAVISGCWVWENNQRIWVIYCITVCDHFLSMQM